MSGLDQELAAYEKMRQDLEGHHLGKWVLVHEGALVEVYDSFASAAADAVSRFGRGPYLIHQIGAPPIVLPASVMFRPV